MLHILAVNSSLGYHDLLVTPKTLFYRVGMSSLSFSLWPSYLQARSRRMIRHTFSLPRSVQRITRATCGRPVVERWIAASGLCAGCNRMMPNTATKCGLVVFGVCLKSLIRLGMNPFRRHLFLSQKQLQSEQKQIRFRKETLGVSKPSYARCLLGKQGTSKPCKTGATVSWGAV